MLGNRRSALASTVDSIKRDINQICQSGDFYVTEELGNEFNTIANGLDHLKLDGNLMNTSADWQRGFDSTQVAAHTANAKNVLDSLAATLYDYKNKMGNTSISSCQENEIRERHHWAVNSLKGVEQEMGPFTCGASDRILQFGDHIGVTDRYTGYRNNLTRGCREPSGSLTRANTIAGSHMMQSVAVPPRKICFGNAQPSEDDIKPIVSYRKQSVAVPPRSLSVGVLPRKISSGNTQPSKDDIKAIASSAKKYSVDVPPRQICFGNAQPSEVDIRGYKTLDSLYPRCNTMFVDDAASCSQALANLKASNGLNASTGRSRACTAMPRGHKNLSVQEQAGINTTYPGKTEYITRYKSPPQNVKTSDFIVNPTPNFMLHGRPLGLTTYSPSFTEYQTRYEWPDGNRIVKLPWRRK